MVEVEVDQPNANAGGSGAATCQAAFWKLHSNRLAHASVSTMRIIKQHNAIPGIQWYKIEFPDEDWKCSICLRAKAAQRAFQRPAPLRAQAYHTGQYLSTDLIGKFEISDMILDLVFFLTLICHFRGRVSVATTSAKQRPGLRRTHLPVEVYQQEVGGGETALRQRPIAG